jgi:hypothetical protein
VSADGYVQAFMQAPPTLDEIFRAEVEKDDAQEVADVVEVEAAK